MSRAANSIDFLQRASFARVFALAFVVIAAVHAGSLQDPPYWDALMGAFAQGHWLATHSFSPLALWREAGPFESGGACVYAFSVYPWLVGGLEALGLAPATSFVVLHVLSFAAAAAIVAALFRMVRDEAGPGLAALTALALMVQPMFRSLAAQMNMDVLLTACTVLSIAALVRARYGAACVWSAVALLIKPTAIILIAGNLAVLIVRTLRPAWFGPAPAAEAQAPAAEGAADMDKRRNIALLVHAALCVIFLIELLVTEHFGKSVTGMTFFGGFVPLFSKRLWALPEFGVALSVFLLLAPWISLRAARGRASMLEISVGLFLLAFTGFYFQYQNVLPRYFLQAWPLLLTALVLAALQLRADRRLISTALVLFAAFGIVNAHGRFYPARYADWEDPETGRRRVANDGWLLERSLEYQDDLALDQELGARMQQARGEVVIAGWPLLHALAIPAFGYVLRQPPRLACAGKTIEFADGPILRIRDLEPSTPTVRVLSPNVFDDDSTRVLPGDEVLEVLTRGRLRAFVIRRPADSGAGRR